MLRVRNNAGGNGIGITNITDCVSCHKSADEDSAQRNMDNRNSGNQNGQQEGHNNEEEDD